MKKFIYLSILAIMLVVGIVLAQKNNGLTIHDRWKKVEELAEKQLPESALKEVELILKQAVEEKNNAEVIKAFVYKMRFTLEREPDKAPALIQRVRSFFCKIDRCGRKSSAALDDSRTLRTTLSAKPMEY
jgi:hypothetical protein